MTDERREEIRKQLWELHQAVIEALLKRITSSDAKAYDFANAIQFMKDNGITKGNSSAYTDSNWDEFDGLDLPFNVEEGEPF